MKPLVEHTDGVWVFSRNHHAQHSFSVCRLSKGFYKLSPKWHLSFGLSLVPCLLNTSEVLTGPTSETGFTVVPAEPFPPPVFASGWSAKSRPLFRTQLQCWFSPCPSPSSSLLHVTSPEPSTISVRASSPYRMVSDCTARSPWGLWVHEHRGCVLGTLFPALGLTHSRCSTNAEWMRGREVLFLKRRCIWIGRKGEGESCTTI